MNLNHFKSWKSWNLKVYKILVAFLNLPVNTFFYKFLYKFFYGIPCNFFSYMQNWLKIHQINIIKQIKKDYKKKPAKDIKDFLKKKEKKATIWSWTIQKSLKKMKSISCYRKNYYRIRKKRLITIIKKYFHLEYLPFNKGKYNKLFSFSPMFEKKFLNRQNQNSSLVMRKFLFYT